MSDNQRQQGWDKVMQPVTFETSTLIPFGWLMTACEVFFLDCADGPDSLRWARHDPKDYHEKGRSTQTATDDSSVVVNRPYLCAQCLATYRRLGDLTRHQKEKHSAASSKYLCHIELCPRGIAGEGFGRMHHLVAHLKSNKHGMDAKEAAYMARQHNLPKSKVAGNGGLGVEEAL